MRSLRSKAIKPLSLWSPFIRFTEFYGMVFALLIFVGYQALAYLGSSATKSDGLAVLSAFSPAIVIFLFMSWTTHYRIIWFFCIISGCIALWHYHSTLAHYLTWVYVIQRSGIFVLLTTVFGVTLLPGHTPIISHIADLVHGPLSERVALYTRHVTIAWAFFFATMTGLPLVIFLFAPQHLLFLLTNIITVTLVASMFFAEYIVRCRAIPVGERSGMIEGLHAYFHYSAKSATSKQQQGNSNPGPPR
ncbi:hypothetical protein [Acidithiobacillus sulfuriphilus]|uniref:hypothetical protein n=1 Tax=Acidithiobacillus sulfuriphilus TaxID=1867749 RepID=UPI003F5F697F